MDAEKFVENSRDNIPDKRYLEKVQKVTGVTESDLNRHVRLQQKIIINMCMGPFSPVLE